MEQKVVSIRMSVANNTVTGHQERDFIEHVDLNKLLAEGWLIRRILEATGGHSQAYTCLTFVLERDISSGEKSI